MLKAKVFKWPILLLSILVTTLSLGELPSHPVPLWEANGISLKKQSLGNGVYAIIADTADKQTPQGIPQPTSGGFIVGEEGVLVIDTMMTPYLTKQVLKLIKEVTNKPIKYVVNTSFHGDHFFGNFLMPAEAHIIQHENAYKLIEQVGIEKLKQMQMGWFGTGRGIEEVQYRPANQVVPAGSRVKIDLGKKVVEVMDLGVGQSVSDLWVWDSQANVIFAGNAFVGESPIIPTLLDGYASIPAMTLTKVYNWLPEGIKIVPGHGRVTNKAGMKFYVDYTNTLVEQMRAATNPFKTEEKSLDKTRDEVNKNMSTFNEGYSLFGWLNDNLNIGTAYQELTIKKANLRPTK